MIAYFTNSEPLHFSAKWPPNGLPSKYNIVPFPLNKYQQLLPTAF